MNQAEIERLRARIAELHECLTKCAESAYEAGVADERERCAKNWQGRPRRPTPNVMVSGLP